MAINPLYIPLFTIEEVILDKDSGLPLSGGIVTFYRDSQRLTPKPVYQISGVSPNYTFTSVGNQLVLGNAGDFVDTNGNPFVPYAFPYDADGNVDLYYVTVVSQGLVSQFVRQAVPYIPNGGDNPGDLSNDGNQISNPQFVELTVDPTAINTIAVTGAGTVTPIAPGWDIVTSGTGNVIIERLQPTASNVPTNPPYALRIEADAALGATITLRQRLTNTPSIFRGGFASAMFAAAVIGGGGSAISMKYAPSTGTETTLIPNTAIPTDGAFHVIQGNNTITVQGNDPADSGYVDINLTIPTARSIAITSIQVIGLAFSADVDFEQQTAARQKDELFHVYENGAVTQSKDTVLTGWNFSLNPFQFNPTASTTAATQTMYIADQTIIHQQAASTLMTGKANSAFGRQGLQVTAINGVTINRFALIQYIDPSTIRPYWSYIMSSLVRAQYYSPDATKSVRVKARLIYRTSLPPSISATEPISSWAANGDPVFAAGWTEIKPTADPAFYIEKANGNPDSNYQGLPFIGFQMPECTDVNMTLGIVIYTIDDMLDTLGNPDTIIFDKISLVQNDFAVDAPPQTYDQCLQECRFYYEKSYEKGVLAGTATTQGGQMYEQLVGVRVGLLDVYARQIDILFKNTKRTSAYNFQFYETQLGNPGGFSVYLRNNGGTNTIASPVYTDFWSVFPAQSENSLSLIPININRIIDGAIAPDLVPEAFALVQYIIDARLGIV